MTPEGSKKMSPLSRAAQSTILTGIARLATITLTAVAGPVLGGIIWLGQDYMNKRFDEIRIVAAAAAAHADVVAVAAQKTSDDVLTLKGDVNVIGANIATAADDRMEFQHQMTKQVDRLTQIVENTSNQVSAISATLGARRAQSGYSSIPDGAGVAETP